MIRAMLAVFAALLPAVAPAAEFPADRVVASASGDWNGDGTPDLALVAKPADGEEADNGLYLYLADPSEARLKLVAALPNTLWGSFTMFGQEPELAALPNGSLKVMTKNDAIGRDRWRQELTLAWRDGRFVVAGYFFGSRDTLDPDAASVCDINLLTGKGKRGDKPITRPGATIAIADWRDEEGQRACGLEQ